MLQVTEKTWDIVLIHQRAVEGFALRDVGTRAQQQTHLEKKIRPTNKAS